MIRMAMTVLVVGLLALQGGCFDAQVNVPDVYVGGNRSAVKGTTAPKTATHAECRQELESAYQEIRRLRDRLDDREEKIDKLEDDKKKLEKRLDRYED
ncbi:MAG: hypothetical protein GXY33_18220 [Phycisphaerae bacterium]|nr:hypothetical protein [Phycisphaerae bacterium]